MFVSSCWDRLIGALVSKPPIVFIIPAYPYLRKNIIVTLCNPWDSYVIRNDDHSVTRERQARTQTSSQFL